MSDFFDDELAEDGSSVQDGVRKDASSSADRITEDDASAPTGGDAQGSPTFALVVTIAVIAVVLGFAVGYFVGLSNPIQVSSLESTATQSSDSSVPSASNAPTAESSDSSSSASSSTSAPALTQEEMEQGTPEGHPDTSEESENQ